MECSHFNPLSERGALLPGPHGNKNKASDRTPDPIDVMDIVRSTIQEICASPPGRENFITSEVGVTGGDLISVFLHPRSPWRRRFAKQIDHPTNLRQRIKVTESLRDHSAAANSDSPNCIGKAKHLIDPNSSNAPHSIRFSPTTDLGIQSFGRAASSDGVMRPPRLRRASQ